MRKRANLLRLRLSGHIYERYVSEFRERLFEGKELAIGIRLVPSEPARRAAAKAIRGCNWVDLLTSLLSRAGARGMTYGKAVLGVSGCL